MSLCELDHLVIAASSLEAGEEYASSLLGARPVRGGAHAAMGTHNALVRLGPRAYIEIIAVDASAAPPSRPRWFELDTPPMLASLEAAPRLVHWAARTRDLARASAAAPECGTIHPMARGAYRWSITIPDDGRRPAGGVLPALIEWADGAHPAQALPDAGLSLVALSGAHPEPAALRDILGRLGLRDAMPLAFAPTPRIAALVKTPRGSVCLGA